MAERILVGDDEETLRRNLVRYLTQQGYEVEGFSTAELAIEAATYTEFTVALVDLRLPGKDGITLATELFQRWPDMPVLVMTAYGSIDSAIDALRAGAQDYLLKPVLLQDVARKIRHACEHRQLVRENVRLRRQLAERSSAAPVVARSPVMKDVVAFIRQVATSNSTILIEGESGSGKEVVARMLHDLSEHRDGPFLAVSMTAVPENLVEACLFGHERGVFTGADSAREGLLRAANRGTLLLDEIGEMPLAHQAKLLRALETKEFIPVGGDKPVQVGTRIVVASSQNLSALVQEKRFRADLYYRLAALRIEVPPLRRRPEDIAPLADALLARHTLAHSRPVIGFDGSAMTRLLAYDWPGNVRELSNVVERATVICAGKIITAADLPANIAGTIGEDEGYQNAVAGFERAFIRSTLERAGGDRREAARVLGLSLATLYRRLEKLGLKDDPAEGAADLKEGSLT